MQPVKPVTYSVIKAGLVGLTRYLATYWSGLWWVQCSSAGRRFNGQGEEFVNASHNLFHCHWKKTNIDRRPVLF